MTDQDVTNRGHVCTRCGTLQNEAIMEHKDGKWYCNECPMTKVVSLRRAKDTPCK